ncbi:hypothetical protein [Labrys neptuniae]
MAYWIDPEGRHYSGDRQRRDRAATADEVLAIETPPRVFLKATRRQFMLALFNAGLLDAAEAIAMGHPYRPVKLEWQNATEFWEDSPTLSALLVELHKTDADLHDLMVAASKL